MDLVNEINPLVKIHHSEKNAGDSAEEKDDRRKAAAKAYKEAFGEDCPWFEDEDDQDEEEEKFKVHSK